MRPVRVGTRLERRELKPLLDLSDDILCLEAVALVPQNPEYRLQNLALPSTRDFGHDRLTVARKPSLPESRTPLNECARGLPPNPLCDRDRCRLGLR